MTIKEKLLKFFKIFCVVILLFNTKLNAQEVVSAPVLESMTSVSLVNQITQWLNGIDQLYGIYDQIMHNIEMIEQQYEQMQFYVERAASWKFNEIEWDGDLDFRNEIREATSQVNKQLTNIRRIKNAFTAKTVNIGGQSFSFASLCGIDDGHGGGNMLDMTVTAMDYYGHSFAKACDAFANEVPENEAIQLWHRYNLSPANYKMVKSVEDKLNEKISYLIASTENDIAEVQEIDEQKYKIIEQIMDMFGQEGLTETEAAQLQGMLELQNFNALRDIEKQIKEGMSYLAWLKVYERQQEESKRQTELERKAAEEHNVLPSYLN